MNSLRGTIPVMVVMTVLALGADLFGQVPRTGQQVPPMPRIWNEGLGSWLTIGLGPRGMVAAISRQFERSVVNFHGGYYWKRENLSGGDLGLTIGLPLSRHRLFASVGGGLGCLIGKFGEAEKSRPELCLAADLQLFAKITSRLGIGFYSDVGVSAHRALGGFFLCIQYGRWQI